MLTHSPEGAAGHLPMVQRALQIDLLPTAQRALPIDHLPMAQKALPVDYLPMARLATRTTSSMVGSARASKFAAYGIGTCGRFSTMFQDGNLPVSMCRAIPGHQAMQCIGLRSEDLQGIASHQECGTEQCCDCRL